MDQIEPNVAGLAVFALAWAASCLAGLQLAGMFPLSQRPDEARRPFGLALVAVTGLAVAAMIAATLHYGLGALRWTSVVVAGGLVFLFIPALFQVLPGAWRDGRAGLAVTLVASLAVIGLLQIA